MVLVYLLVCVCVCVSGRRLKVLWGKAQTTPSLGVKGQQTLAPVPGLPAGECVLTTVGLI